MINDKIHIDLDEICDFHFDKCDRCGVEEGNLVDYPGYILCQKCKLEYPFKFSFYQNGITNCYPIKSINIKEFIQLLKQPNSLVEKARTLSDKKERDSIKSKMNYVTFGGVFNKRSNKNLVKSSGFACFDIDEIKNLEEVKQELIEDRYTHLLFVSPSGNGLKLIVKIPAVKDDLEYKEYWESIAQYYDLPEQDKSCKDISRACYLSVDPTPYFNQYSEIYTNKIKKEVVEQKKILISNPTPKTNNSGKSNAFLDKLKSFISMEQVLSSFGVDTSKNPTDCPFHSCSQRCLSFNSEVAHCFDSDCAGDNSWNIFSFVKKANNCDSAEAIKWLAEFGGLQEEYEQSKQEYLNREKEPKGWACAINIKKFAIKHNFTKCHICNTDFQFNEKLGFYSCPSCKYYGGLKKFAELIVKRNQLEVQNA